MAIFRAGTLLSCLIVLGGCKKDEAAPAPAPAPTAPEAVVSKPPPLDPNNIVSIALASKDHTTLVAALKAADYVTAIANPGPLTVFAPTDAAFAKLPAGTVDDLVKPENKDKLKEILKYHATTSVYDVGDLKDGQLLAMSNGAKVTIHITDGKLIVNDAHVTASVRASNGIVHIIDTVLIPPAPAPQ
jgi:uncharacterized surface protein with fasciclin (FAS1) repeats